MLGAFNSPNNLKSALTLVASQNPDGEISILGIDVPAHSFLDLAKEIQGLDIKTQENLKRIFALSQSPTAATAGRRYFSEK
jgi:hypothetical protein